MMLGLGLRVCLLVCGRESDMIRLLGLPSSWSGTVNVLASCWWKRIWSDLYRITGRTYAMTNDINHFQHFSDCVDDSEGGCLQGVFWRCQIEILKQQPRQESGEVNHESLNQWMCSVVRKTRRSQCFTKLLGSLFAWNYQVMQVEH
jgi:hypothetical protein